MFLIAAPVDRKKTQSQFSSAISWLDAINLAEKNEFELQLIGHDSQSAGGDNGAGQSGRGLTVEEVD